MADARGHNVRVLVADDHAAVRKSLRQLLQDGGMQVVGEAGDGRDAVCQCEHFHPDVVVLDISMPLLNGFDAARQIARLCPATKVIFLTGHTLAEYAREAFRVGAAGFVTKQNAAVGLLAAIEAALQGKSYDSRTAVA